jgi:pimeloyl-ACP methyl ester carboxylesterase
MDIAMPINELSACVGGLEPSRGQVHAGGIIFSYLEWGESGAPLLLLHGITSSARGWWRVAPELVALGYHVYAPDMPGHGQSQLVDAHRIDQIARRIGDVLDTLQLAKPVVIGHSWGGAVALELAASIVVARVALVDPLLALSSERGALRLPAYLEGLGLSPDATLPAIRAANPDWHACDFVWKGEALQQCRADAVRGLFIGSGDWDLTPLFSRIEVPLLLLLADPQYSVIAPATLSAVEEALRPDLGQVTRVAGTNHNMFRGGFVPFMRVLLPWLSQ